MRKLHDSNREFILLRSTGFRLSVRVTSPFLLHTGPRFSLWPIDGEHNKLEQAFPRVYSPCRRRLVEYGLQKARTLSNTRNDVTNNTEDLMTNARIADIFDEVADMLEFRGANPFRLRAYRNGARTIRHYAEPLAKIVGSDSRKLVEIDGIGKDLATKIETLVETNKLPMHEELKEEIPATVFGILRIPGLGPKKAAVLYNDMGIQSLDQLKAACEAEEVRNLKGFGAKTEKLILDGIPYAESAASQTRIQWATADDIAQELLAHMKKCKAIGQMEMAGSYRRRKETIGDLDVLVTCGDSDTVMDHFGEFAEVDDIIVRGSTKMSVRLHSGLQIDLRVVPDESFGAALQYFTGSKEHNVVVRGLAKQAGMKVNEWGVYSTEGDNEGEQIAGATEKEVYAALGLPEFPPELREARHEFEWAERNELPTLVELTDIKGDLHMHTTDTDGKGTIMEMVEAAKTRGMKYIAITDHSQRVAMANGLDPERCLEQWEEIDQINKEIGRSFTVLKGIECDILEKGGMDLPDDVLEQADWVMASIHYGQQQSQDQLTKRMVDAIANPNVSAISHPTGRLINKRKPYEIDVEAVMNAAVEYGKFLELNAHPKRLDLHDTHCAMAKERGIPIVISTDAHSVAGMDVMRYGVLQARRAGLSKSDVANTRTWTQLKKLLG